MKSIIKWLFFVIIVVAIIIVGFNLAKEEKYKNEQEDIKTEMLVVQGKAKIVLENYHVNNENGLKGEKMADTSYEEQYGISEISNYYKWDIETLKEVGVTEPILSEDDYYLINYDTEEVVYSKGYTTDNGNTYYKLSDIKNAEEAEKENTVNQEENTENQEVEEVKQNDGEGEPKTE